VVIKAKEKSSIHAINFFFFSLMRAFITFLTS